MKFMCIHTLPPHAIPPQQLEQFAEAAQRDPKVRGYRSFANLSEGKVLCILEAPDKRAIGDWFSMMGMPVDSIHEVEFEGERGIIHQESISPATATA